ncbi:DsbA family oxidoreductase [Leucobacter denitrificans]|uniref:DsbA family oxidoreductase n=1 Tax=Leucobacter denitrificans TaxID=683042 RepID=A0A7G9S4I6_9MICO|nr:DsbA family oxidoreductase [Leucobacter denitrificans]QNN62761.1 DsbA family oxidoreductase [Leucobacter denitrificans]
MGVVTHMVESATQEPAINISVWFDVRCPWCYLGKRRLERAIEQFEQRIPGVPVNVQHHSFELAPGIAERFEGGEAEYLLQYEGVPLEQSARTLPALEQLAAVEDVDIRFDTVKNGNTRKAHRVYQYAQNQGLGEEFLERMFAAYFSESADLSLTNVLGTLAADVGLDGEAAEAAAESEEWDPLVKKDHVRAQMLGSGGVPFALVNAKYSISGAQEAEIVAAALVTVAERDLGITAKGQSEEHSGE